MIENKIYIHTYTVLYFALFNHHLEWLLEKTLVSTKILVLFVFLRSYIENSDDENSVKTTW